MAPWPRAARPLWTTAAAALWLAAFAAAPDAAAGTRALRAGEGNQTMVLQSELESLAATEAMLRAQLAEAEAEEPPPSPPPPRAPLGELSRAIERVHLFHSAVAQQAFTTHVAPKLQRRTQA